MGASTSRQTGEASSTATSPSKSGPLGVRRVHRRDERSRRADVLSWRRHRAVRTAHSALRCAEGPASLALDLGDFVLRSARVRGQLSKGEGGLLRAMSPWTYGLEVHLASERLRRTPRKREPISRLAASESRMRVLRTIPGLSLESAAQGKREAHGSARPEWVARVATEVGRGCCQVEGC
jgi:hypothetical protein